MEIWGSARVRWRTLIFTRQNGGFLRVRPGPLTDPHIYKAECGSVGGPSYLQGRMDVFCGSARVRWRTIIFTRQNGGLLRVRPGPLADPHIYKAEWRSSEGLSGSVSGPSYLQGRMDVFWGSIRVRWRTLIFTRQKEVFWGSVRVRWRTLIFTRQNGGLLRARPGPLADPHIYNAEWRSSEGPPGSVGGPSYLQGRIEVFWGSARVRWRTLIFTRHNGGLLRVRPGPLADPHIYKAEWRSAEGLPGSVGGPSASFTSRSSGLAQISLSKVKSNRWFCLRMGTTQSCLVY